MLTILKGGIIIALQHSSMYKLYTIAIKFKFYKLIINNIINIINHYYIKNITIYFHCEIFEQSKTLKGLESADFY